MATFPLVSLPAGIKTPGVYTQVNLNGAGLTASPNNKVLLWHYVGADAPADLFTARQVISQAQVDALCKSWSPLAHMFAAAASQLPQGIGAEFWIVPLPEPSSGSLRSAKIKILGKASSGTVSTGTAAAAADTLTFSYRGRSVKVGVSVGDTWAQIAAKLNTAINAVASFPVTSSVSTDTVTVSERVKGAFDPGSLQVDFENQEASLCAASPGTLTFASAATASGTCTVKLGVGLVSYSITNGDAATASAAGLSAAIRADSYQCDSAAPGTPDGSIVLYYRNGRPYRPVSASLSGVTGQTLTIAADTPGTGTPTITAALTRLSSDETAFKAWAVSFDDTTNLSAVVAHVEANEAAGTYEKGQMVFLAQCNSATDASSVNLPDATSPKMTASSRYVVLHQAGSPQAAWELSARVATEVAATAFPAQNFNGVKLRTNEVTPLGVPHKADRSTRTECNTLISTYKLAPLIVDSSGSNAVLRSNSTYAAQGAADEMAEKWSWRISADYIRQSIRVFLAWRFGDKSLKRYGTARTSRVVMLEGVRSALVEVLKKIDDEDVYDDIESLKAAVLAGVKVGPDRIDLAAPLRTVNDIDQIAVALVQQ